MKRRLHRFHEKRIHHSYIERFPFLCRDGTLARCYSGYLHGWERSLSIFFWFISIGGQGVGGMNKCCASLYDERFRCCHWYWLFDGLGSWAFERVDPAVAFTLVRSNRSCHSYGLLLMIYAARRVGFGHLGSAIHRNI